MNQEHAFPNPHRTDLTGMTLRDYFAAKAMHGLLGIYDRVVPDTGETKKQTISKLAYEMADAMLEARK
jgi:hypothetical protein